MGGLGAWAGKGAVFPGEEGGVEGDPWGTAVGGALPTVTVDTAPTFCSYPHLLHSDSKLQEELRALRETFSNFTVSTEVEVKALSSQGEGGRGWGWGAVER